MFLVVHLSGSVGHRNIRQHYDPNRRVPLYKDLYSSSIPESTYRVLSLHKAQSPRKEYIQPLKVVSILRLTYEIFLYTTRRPTSISSNHLLVCVDQGINFKLFFIVPGYPSRAALVISFQEIFRKTNNPTKNKTNSRTLKCQQTLKRQCSWYNP